MSKLKLSATRISTFFQCKYRYFKNYVEHAPKLPNASFKLGTTCHAALEYAGRLWQEEGLQEFSKEHIKDILKQYDSYAAKEGLEDYPMYKEGKQLVRKRLNNFAIGRRILALEIKFGFPGSLDAVTSNGVPLIGAIDKVVELDDDTILIIDYKTSQTAPDKEKLKSDVQLSMYNLVIKQLFPEYRRVILGLDMLRKSTILYTYRTESELAEFEDYLLAMYEEMSSFKEEDAEPTVNSLCGWCDYRNICPEYKKVTAKEDYNFLQLHSMDDSQLISEWEHVKAVKKILEQRERELAAVMLDKIKVQGMPIVDDSKEIVIRQNSRTTYDPKELSKLIPYEDFVSLSTISPKKLKDYVESNVKLKPLLDDFSITNYTSPFLAPRKRKDKK